MNRITDDLRRFPRFPQPNFAPPGEGGDGGEGGDLGIGESEEDDFAGIFDEPDEDGDDDSLIEIDGENEDEGGITLDPTDVLGDLFKAPKGKVDADGNPIPPKTDTTTEPTPQEVQAELATNLKNGIDGLSIPEDMIPEDFNGSDPKQLRALLGRVQQHTARNAINLMFAPVQVALGRMATQLRREMAASSQNTFSESAAVQLLEQNVPAARNPKLRPMVDLIFSQAKVRFPGNMRAQVSSTKKALTAMGIRSGSTAPRGPSGGTRTREGSQGLDLYAPMAKPKTKQGNGTTRNLTPAQKQLMRLLAAK
jgi:hypothetical protein